MAPRVLVTGGGGFIGSHLARFLHERGHYVRVVDVKFDEYMEDAYFSERLTLDLRVLENCLRATRGIDDVYNLAANMGGIGFITTVAADVMRDNVLISANMLEACMRNSVHKVFFSSSACIYPGYRQTEAEVTSLKEADAYPADPNEAYGWEKLFSEEMMKAYQRDYGVRTRIARYHNIYGPEGTYRGGREKAPAALCRKVAEASDPGRITVWGDGKATRSYCFISDCVSGTLALMESGYSRPVNIGSDTLISVDDLADMVIGISGKGIEKIYDLAAPQGVRGRNADLSLAHDLLGWRPAVSLEDGMTLTYHWINAMLSRDKSRAGHAAQSRIPR